MPEIARIFDLLTDLPQRFPDGREVFSCLSGDEIRKISPKKYIDDSRRLACSLISAGVKKGEHIATLLSNRPEWNTIDMGIQLAGAVQVPIYPTSGQSNFRFILNDAEVRFLFIDGEKAWQNIEPVIAEIPTLKQIIFVDPFENYRTLHQLLESEPDVHTLQELQSLSDGIDPESIATIIYTSGTTGRPKGVMLTHHNIVSNLLEVSRIFAQNPLNSALSILPLCHVYERILNYTYQCRGTSIHYVASVENFRENLLIARPEMFCVVPRLLEKAFSNIMQRGRNLKGLRRNIFFWAIEFGQQFEPAKKQSLFSRMKHSFADRLVFSKLRESFGGRLDTIVSGGASLNPKIARVFWAAGIKVMEGYGLTETSPVIAVGTFEKGGICIGTVGPVLPGIQIAFANDGEILCKGPNVMAGYYNRPERTAEVIDNDGWFHTGDIGRLVNGKFLQITDRKKEIFKTSGGKYVAPQVLENRLKESPFVDFVMVIGENRNHPAAIIVLNFQYVRAWCEVKGIEYSRDLLMVLNERIIHRIAEEIADINLNFSRPEQIKKFILVTDSWSVDSGELSPTMKLRRGHIAEKYAARIEKLYEEV